jgi:hypothetical protein
MGNQPSAPQQAPPPQPMPLPPVCDSECQRQKLLSGLQTNMDQKEQTKDSDPEGYEQARIAYYTALYGDSWLASEKQRIAQDEISPKITSYSTQYEDLKKQQSSQQVFINLMNALQAQEIGDEKDLDYLKKQFQAEKDKADVLNRLAVLGTQPTDSTNYTPIILDIVLAILGIVILYFLYTKFDVIKGYLGMSSSSMVVGGKRLRN